jgi:radical SAM protein with 4Fe4S-binding SPASM domain
MQMATPLTDPHLSNDVHLWSRDVYVYELPDEVPDRFLIFSFPLHYWFATNAQGAAIVNELNGKSIGTLKSWAAREFGIAESIFDTDVSPFIQNLLRLGFVAASPDSIPVAPSPPVLNLDDPKQYPFETMFVSLGDQCNLDCSYCFNKEQRNARLHEGATKPDVAALETVMHEFRNLGGQQVCFTGGEPTLNPDLIELCQSGKRMGLHTGFITNGTRLKSLSPTAVVEAVDHIAVSLDTMQTSEMVELWGTGRYDAETDVLDPIKQFLSIADARNASLRISIKPTVTAINAKSMPALVQTVTRAVSSPRLSWDVGRFDFIGLEKVDKVLGLSENAYDDVLVGCASSLMAPANDYETERFGLGELGMRLPSRHRKLLPCSPSFFVTPTGDVYPCQQLELQEFRLGNIHEASLRTMFAHDSWTRLRKNMTVDSLEVCKDCELRYACAKHCHGKSVQCTGCTTTFLEPDTKQCRSRLIRQLWLETRPCA